MTDEQKRYLHCIACDLTMIESIKSDDMYKIVPHLESIEIALHELGIDCNYFRKTPKISPQKIKIK
jgi:hypothetical protein